MYASYLLDHPTSCGGFEGKPCLPPNSSEEAPRNNFFREERDPSEGQPTWGHSSELLLLLGPLVLKNREAGRDSGSQENCAMCH